MGSYGRNLEFRVPPVHGQRGGRYVAPAAVDLPLGVPVLVAPGATPDALGRLPVALATGAQPKPAPGQGGLILFEYGPAAMAGQDPFLTTYSDLDKAPRGMGVQLISGDHVKVVFSNTTARTFLNSRQYTGRLMVAPAGLATLAVGDYLSPGTGTDVAGYWAESTAANGWLVVEGVDIARGQVEARFLF